MIEFPLTYNDIVKDIYLALKIPPLDPPSFWTRDIIAYIDQIHIPVYVNDVLFAEQMISPYTNTLHDRYVEDKCRNVNLFPSFDQLKIISRERQEIFYPLKIGWEWIKYAYEHNLNPQCKIQVKTIPLDRLVIQSTGKIPQIDISIVRL